MALLEANTIRACDLIDGVADGLIGDPRKCTVELLELDALACDGEPSPDCLTPGQIETARYLYTGITDDAGNVVVPGVYPGAELGGDFQFWVTGPAPFPDGTANELTVQVLAAVMHRQPDFSLDTFDVVKGIPGLKETMVSVDVPAPDFSAFQESGGKLIIYNGWHDHPCRAKVVENFLVDAEELNGAEAVDDTLRAFMVPGMVHCLGGPGAWAADYIQAIVDWVESDVAPDRIVAEHPGYFTFLDSQAAIGGRTVNWSEAILEAGEAMEDRKRFSRPLFPYPQRRERGEPQAVRCADLWHALSLAHRPNADEDVRAPPGAFRCLVHCDRRHCAGRVGLTRGPSVRLVVLPGPDEAIQVGPVGSTRGNSGIAFRAPERYGRRVGESGGRCGRSV